MIIIKKLNYFFPIIVIILLSGCAPKGPKPLYNYDNYAQSYYNYKKNMSPETTLALKESIEKVIADTADSSSGRVPPGMYANLGYMYLKSANPDQAIVNFTKEKTIYPESTLFMDRMINKIKSVEGEKNDKQ